MATTYSDAADEVQGIVKQVWDGVQALLALDYAPEMRWPGVEIANKPERDKYFGRTSLQNVVAARVAIGGKLYRDTNLLFVQVFCPRNGKNSFPNGRIIAEALRTAFCQVSPSGELDFYSQSIRELVPEQDFYRLNVVVTFGYDTLQ